jgi:hypothetical protein
MGHANVNCVDLLGKSDHRGTTTTRRQNVIGLAKPSFHLPRLSQQHFPMLGDDMTRSNVAARNASV